MSAGKIIVLDGGTGTELERRGATMVDEAWCAMATLSDPDILRGVHEDYIRAGARIITANTFATNRTMLEPAGFADRFDEINRRGVEIALEARDRMNANDTVAVAGSMSHQIPVTAGTDKRDLDRLPDTEIIAANNQELATTLADAGVDFILMEMMSDPALANPAIAAAKATGLPVWIGFSCRGDDQGAPVSFHVPELGLSEMLDNMPADGASAIGVMHTNVSLISDSIKIMGDRFVGPIMAYPDSGYFEMPNWCWVDIISTQDFADAALAWVDEGAQIVGGCCGLGVEHIEALANGLARR